MFLGKHISLFQFFWLRFGRGLFSRSALQAYHWLDRFQAIVRTSHPCFHQRISHKTGHHNSKELPLECRRFSKEFMIMLIEHQLSPQCRQSLVMLDLNHSESVMEITWTSWLSLLSVVVSENDSSNKRTCNFYSAEVGWLHFLSQQWSAL